MRRQLLSFTALVLTGFCCVSELPAQDSPCGAPITWDFNSVPSCTSYGILTMPGGALGECFVGQTVRDDGEFETVSGTPSFPLRLKDSGSNEGLCAYNAGGGDIRVAGLRGPMGDGCSNPQNIGEGALTLWFRYGTPWITMNNWCDSDFFETVTAKFYARDGSLIQTITNCEHLAFHVNGDQRLIYGVVITNDDGGGIGFDNITFFPVYEDLGNELLDPYDTAVRSFEDIFPDPALETLESDFVTLTPSLRGRMRGTISSVVYWSPVWNLYAYLWQIEISSGGTEVLREVALPFATDLCVAELNSFHLEDDPAGVRCGLGGDLANHFVNYGFEEGGTCVNRAARPTGSGGTSPSCIRGAGWVTRFVDLKASGGFPLSEIVGVLSTKQPAHAKAYLIGDRSAGSATVIAPARDPIAIGTFFQGINAPAISGTDVLITAIVKDPVLRTKSYLRVFDPGDKEKLHRSGLAWMFHNAPQASDRVGFAGHSHGGDRAYRITTELKGFFDRVGVDLDWLAPIDPIDPFVCEDFGNCDFDDADQSDILKPAPAGVVFLNHVQRFDIIEGYNIGNWAENCTSGEETSFSNLTCEATWVFFHTEIDNDPRVHTDIVSALKKLFP